MHLFVLTGSVKRFYSVKIQRHGPVYYSGMRKLTIYRFLWMKKINILSGRNLRLIHALFDFSIAEERQLRMVGCGDKMLLMKGLSIPQSNNLPVFPA